MFKLRLEGKAEVDAELDKAGKPSRFKQPVQEAADFIKNQLTEYPPYGGGAQLGGGQAGISMLKSKPGSKYQRTGNLARGWKYRTREYVRSWAAFITNDVPYVSYVQVAGSQTATHKGFWRTTDEVLKDAERKAYEKFSQKFIIDIN